MDLILDTSLLIEIENENNKIIDRIAELKTDNDQIFITFFTFCEMYVGCLNKIEKNKLQRLERLHAYNILQTTERTAILFSELLHHLKNKGKMIPYFDIFISAFALEHDMVLITADGHFKNIPNLKLLLLEL